LEFEFLLGQKSLEWVCLILLMKII